jgi:hypothetical protein
VIAIASRLQSRLSQLVRPDWTKVSDSPITEAKIMHILITKELEGETLSYSAPVHDRSICARAISSKFIIRECKQTNLLTLTLIMTPTTRYGRYQTPPPGTLEGVDVIIIRKSWYYNAIDQNPEEKLRRQIANDCDINKSTG